MSECPADGSALLPEAALLPVDPPLAAGTMAGEYRVDKKLGAGTFGAVYAGEQPLIGKRVAIKVLHRRFSSDAEVVSRFIAEARAVNRIRHKNIIDIFSFGLLPDRQHYFVMELLDGLTLGELLERERRLSPARALPILRGIAAGLDAAHEANVTHRDLKPDNVFLALEKDGGYFPKLLDFGIAKLVTDEMAHKTATGVAVGTPRYMSPEQSRGRKIDHRADIYALGVVIHEVLTGKPPFDGESMMDLLIKHATVPAPRMSSVCPDLPPELDAPVLAMLEKRPNARPASAGSAVAALDEAVRALGLDVARAPAEPAVTAEIPDEEAPAPSTEVAPQDTAKGTVRATPLLAKTAPADAPQRARQRWVVIAAVAIGLAVGVIGFLLRISAGPAPAAAPSAPAPPPSAPSQVAKEDPLPILPADIAPAVLQAPAVPALDAGAPPDKQPKKPAIHKDLDRPAELDAPARKGTP
jgi:serine/threonine-protein kinase